MRNNAWTPLGYSYHDAFASSALAICCTTNPDLLDFRTYRIPRDLYRPNERKVAAGRCCKQAPRVVLPRCEKTSDTNPSSTIRPWCITMTRSQIWLATRKSCVIKRMPIEVSRWISSSKVRICACTDTSRAETASSAMRSLGSQASALAIEMRWRCPPENSLGL
jgi:hypothetical protein